MGVEKVILRRGDGPKAKIGQKLRVDYFGTDKQQNQRIFDSSYERRRPFDFEIGMGRVIKGWDEGIVGMRVGETALLKITPDYAEQLPQEEVLKILDDWASSPRGLRSVIPPVDLICFEIRLLDILK